MVVPYEQVVERSDYSPSRTAAYFMKVARQLDCKYVITGNVDKVKFQGNTIL